MMNNVLGAQEGRQMARKSVKNRKQQADAVGQEIINLLYERHHDVDVQLILSVLCSVTAHFIAGLPADLRSGCYSGFGLSLLSAVNDLVDRPHHRADVMVVPEVLQ